MKKILLVGGTGIAGEIIYKHLSNLSVDIYIASRNVVISERGRQFITLDINQIETYKDVIKQYDIIIVAAGPFRDINIDFYKFCALNNIICVDINDDYNFCNKMLKLNDTLGIKVTGSIISGLGLAPGLTTFMLKYGAEKLTQNPTKSKIRIFFGSGVVSGKASIKNMFDAFAESAYIMCDNIIRHCKSSDKQKDKCFTFSSIRKNKQLIFYSALELMTIKKDKLFRDLTDINGAFHLQNFPMLIIPFLKRSKFLRQELTNITINKQNSLNSVNSDESVFVSCVVEHGEERVKCSVNYASSFELTAIFCVIIIKLILNGKITLRSGILSFEDLTVESYLIIDELLKYKIRIKIDDNEIK